MKFWHWRTRRGPIPGQSRPRGLFLERVPVREAGLATERPAAPTEDTAPLWLPPGVDDPVREQFAGVQQLVEAVDAQFAGLRRAVAGLDGQLAAAPRAARGQDDEVAAQAVVRALEMAGQLAYARHVLHAYGADRALLASLTPPPAPELEAWFERTAAAVRRY